MLVKILSMDTDELKNQATSVASPRETILDALNMVKRIHSECDLTQYIEQSLISMALDGLKWESIKLQISTCVQYGLLTNKKGVGYKATDLFFRYLEPTNTSVQLREMQIEMFRNVELYKKIIAKYGGKVLPAPEVLPNILRDDFEVSEHSMIKTAKVLFANIRELELKDHSSEILKVNLADDHKQPENSVKPLDISTPATQTKSVHKTDNVQAAGNLKVTLQIPLASGVMTTLIVEGISDIDYIRDLIVTLRSLS